MLNRIREIVSDFVERYSKNLAVFWTVELARNCKDIVGTPSYANASFHLNELPNGRLYTVFFILSSSV